MFTRFRENKTRGAIFYNMILSAISLFINGFGIHLTIRANLGVGPWDVLSIGLSKTTGILYGTASIIISFVILIIDILLKEPIGISMFLDAIIVGKSVDFFNWIDVIPVCDKMYYGIPMMIVGLFVLGYTQYAYMVASLGCGPRDTLLVGLNKRVKKAPIGLVSICLLSLATFIGWLLGGPVGIGTLICAFGAGPVMQLCFKTVKFKAIEIRHQNLKESFKVLFGRKEETC